jgi:hypothetical protein
MGEHAVILRTDGSRPWMGLPASTVGTDKTVTETMEAANMLNWNVRKRLIETDALTDSDDFEIIRDVPGGVHRMHIAGERYVTVQNEELAALADGITDGDIEADVVGHYNNGRNIFMTFCLGENIVLDPNGSADEIGRYFSIISSNDGSAAITALTHNMRLDCQNMLRAVKSEALSVFKMRHTQTVKGRMDDARKALSIAFKQSEVFEAEMQALIQKEMDKAAFFSLVETIYPKPEKDVRGSVKKWDTKIETLAGIWNGPTVAELEDTAYKAYNVLNEHLLWYPGIRAGNTENALVRASGFNETANKENLSLFKAVAAAV